MTVPGLGPSETVLGVLGPKKVEELARQALQPITGQFKLALSEGGAKANFSILESNIRYNQAYLANEEKRVREAYPNLAKAETLTKMLGPNAGPFLDSTDLKKNVHKEIRMYIDGVTDKIISGEPNPTTNEPFRLSDAIDDYTHKLKLAGEGADGKPLPPRPVDLESLMDRIYGGIIDKTINEKASKDFAASVFSDKRLMPMIKESEKMNFLRKFAGPEVGERIYGFKDEKLILDYKRFMLDGVTAAANHIAGDVREAQNFKDFYSGVSKLGLMGDLKYNPETNRVEGRVASPQEIRQRGNNPTATMVLESQAQRANKTIQDINSVLGVMEPIFSRDGPASVPPGLMSTLGRLGIPVQVPESVGGKPKATDATTPPTAAPTSGGTKTQAISPVGQAFETLMSSPDTLITYQGRQFTAKELGTLIDKMPMAPGQQPAGDKPSNFRFIEKDTQPALVAPQPTLPPGSTKMRGSENKLQLDQMTPEQLNQLNADMSNKVSFAAEASQKTPAQKAIDEATLPKGAKPAAYTPETGGERRAIDRPLPNLIFKAEVKAKDGDNYNTAFGNRKFPITNMSVNEVLELQQSLPKGERAVGAGQFIPSTLKSLVKDLGLTGNEKMTPELQNRMVEQLMERRGYSAWKAGKLSDEQFADRLSKEWAALPNPKTGKSYYAGDGVNANTVSLKRFLKALEEEKTINRRI
jgi:hypothetical protein